MRLVITKKQNKKETWQKWFAWLPVRVEAASGPHYWCWLEAVERKAIYGYGGWDWRYREICNF